jgi:hypothetical protein
MEMNKNLFIAIRFDDATDAFIFSDENEARAFMAVHPEYADLLESGIYTNAAEALACWG